MKIISPHGGVSQRFVSFSSLIFRFCCSCHGLEAGFPKIRIISLVLWFFGTVFSPIAVAIYFLSTTLLSEDRVGLSEITGGLAAISYMLWTLATVNAFILNRKSVQGLVQSEGTKALDVLVPLVCSIPFLLTCLSIVCRVNRFPIIIGYVNYAGFKLSATVFSMVYANVGSSILSQLENLHELVRSRDVSWNFLLSEKIRIRKEIESVNSIFARPLTFQYVLMILGVTSDVAAVMGSTLRNLEKIVLLISTFTYLANLIYAAQKGSMVISQSVDTEFYVWTLVVSRVDVRDSERQWEAIGVFRFREEWDTLRVACFASDLGNLVSFLSATITCVAVVLQFDYKFARYITNSANAAS